MSGASRPVSWQLGNDFLATRRLHFGQLWGPKLKPISGFIIEAQNGLHFSLLSRFVEPPKLKPVFGFTWRAEIRLQFIHFFLKKCVEILI
jgi:hypothetical protein